jgi:hypothetical protein
MRGPESLYFAVEAGVNVVEGGVLYVCGLESSVVSDSIAVASAVEGGEGIGSACCFDISGVIMLYASAF